MEQPQPAKSDLQERIATLPLVEAGRILDHTTALAALQHLRQRGFYTKEQITAYVDGVFGDVTYHLEQDPDQEFLTVSPLQLRGIIARSIITGIGQAAYDIGGAQRSVTHLQHLFDMETVDEPSAITDIAPETGV